ncbi:longitudinals lacking protein, isoforms N/O/W/X/Y-like isoform X1 [Chrysoperla carnea]|uniref:longitudinals lacking protein, isoforms N/O/W/X/Y-like isoform X1 n=1 Tax=Chrysoperla carnea TaxID=189513 RepID=UPI001D07C433|nr:longitudinals lacking protein, isoforms N/O/W/X/Y-like isoform X1 [Chrysoperla carnea]
MGTSEHYCLRWNNHQNNLLGVFSQLLRDESLVDVTLACSEGHSIRAHRVVLSACSSYFQTLFVDHPSRHPIVILKDVRFAELRTLIEFMYRGEVNVEYCQLSALLKTAESLKVKGLAEMTNLSSSTTASSSSITSPIVPSNSASSAAGVSGTPTSTVTSQHDNPTLPPPSATSTVRMSGSVVDHIDQRVLLEREHLALRERERENRELHMNERDRIDRVGEHVMKQEPVDIPSHHQRLSALVDDAQGHTTSSSTPPPQSRRQCSSASPPPPQSQQTSAIINRRMGPSSSSSEDTGGRGNNNDDGGSGVISPRPPLDHHDQDSVVNLTTSSCSTTSTAERTAPSDLSVQLQTNNNNNSSTIGPPPSCSSSSSRIPSASPGHHHDTEPIAGPSGLPPVQQVPLSLKKEVDWGGGMSDEKSIVDPDYSRHPYDQFYLDDDASSSRSSTPFPFLWGMFGASPLDDASSRLLGLLNSRLAAVASTSASGASTPHEIGDQFRCIVCLASFPSGWLLKRHAILQHSILPTSLTPTEEKPFVCEQCGQSYRYRSAYLKHREQNHRARLPADKLFTCDVCGMQFRYLKSFKKHRLNHALERLHGKSLNADGEYSGSENLSHLVLDRYIGEKASQNETESNEVTSTINEVIGLDDEQDKPVNLSDDKKEEIKIKQELVEETLPTQTAKKSGQVCDQDNTIDSLTYSAGSSSHQLPSTTTLPIDAFQLAQEASILNLLQADAIERHQRERRFACPFCGKCVRSKENLKLHVRKHTGERPFVCLFCGRAFGGKSDLTRHLRIHTGERPYHCEACGKCFARADYLSKHLTTHMHSPR